MRTTSDLELMVRLERRAAGPLRAQLEEQLRAAVRSGRLAAGARLPSTRALARDLDVSRGVVVDAYAQLAAEGYLVARRGAPTRVSETAMRPTDSGRPLAEERPPRFDFRPGGPDVSLFPRQSWATSLRRGLRDAPHARLDYGDPRGAPELRRALTAYLGRVRGVDCDPGCVIVTSGMAQGMALVGRTVLARGGCRVGVEDPGSGPARGQLATTGLEPLAVPVDHDGLRPDALAEADVDVVLVTPAHQFPTGVVLAPERRAALLDWASHGGLVHAGGQMCEQMESGGDPADPHGWQVARQRRDQGVPAAPVGATGAPQVAIELAALDEVRKRELLDHGRAEVVLGLRMRQLPHQRLGDH